MGSSVTGKRLFLISSSSHLYIIVIAPRLLVLCPSSICFCYRNFATDPIYFHFCFSSQGKRSCRADVWSFAVTVWEIFLNCKEIPYADLTVAQVLENCGHCYQNETYIGGNGQPDDNNDQRNHHRILSQPDHCPDDLYRVMKKCWSTRIEDRPQFAEIHLYLERLALD